MILVFLCFLAVFILLDLIFISLILSSIKIEIKNLKLSNLKQYTKDDYIVKISLNLFNRIKWISIGFDRKRIKKISSKIDTKKIDSRKVIKNMKEINVKAWKRLKPNLEQFNFLARLGMEDAVITSSIVTAASILISSFIPQLTSNINLDDFKYDVIPVYNKNVYYIELNCIFSVKLVHIINIIYIYLKERKM